MDWDAIGAIGEMLGSIAVIVTLGYLAVQVKHARSEARRAVRQGRGEAFRDVMALQNQEDMIRIYVKADTTLGAPPTAVQALLMDQAGLTREEALRLAVFQFTWLGYGAQVIPNVEGLTALERTQFENSVRGTYRERSVGRLFWESVRPSASPDLVSYVDNWDASRAFCEATTVEASWGEPNLCSTL